MRYGFGKLQFSELSESLNQSSKWNAGLSNHPTNKNERCWLLEELLKCLPYWASIYQLEAVWHSRYSDRIRAP
ncbi:MAG: hypothetical protein ACI8P0_004470 [Planctomycetaceae bacterium]|jgi:hypothetical protein